MDGMVEVKTSMVSDEAVMCCECHQMPIFGPVFSCNDCADDLCSGCVASHPQDHLVVEAAEISREIGITTFKQPLLSSIFAHWRIHEGSSIDPACRSKRGDTHRGMDLVEIGDDNFSRYVKDVLKIIPTSMQQLREDSDPVVVIKAICELVGSGSSCDSNSNCNTTTEAMSLSPIDAPIAMQNNSTVSEQYLAKDTDDVNEDLGDFCNAMHRNDLAAESFEITDDEGEDGFDEGGVFGARRSDIDDVVQQVYKDVVAQFESKWVEGIVDLLALLTGAVTMPSNRSVWNQLPPIIIETYGESAGINTSVMKLLWLPILFNASSAITFEYPEIGPRISAPLRRKESPANISNSIITLQETNLQEIGCDSSDAQSIPVYLIPFSEILDHTDIQLMPAFQTCGVKKNGTKPTLLPCDHVLFFFSHQWGTQSDPDPHGKDWKLLQSIVISCVWAAVDVVSIFSMAGFSIDLLRYLASNLTKNDITHLRSLYEDFPCERASVTGNVFGKVVMTLLRIHEEYTSTRQEGKYLSMHERRIELATACFERVYIWIDFCCLPQAKGTRGVTHERTETEAILMAQSLRYLSDIQEAMITIVSNESSEYIHRAWCFAELQLTNTSILAYEGDNQFDQDMEADDMPVHALTQHQLRNCTAKLLDVSTTGPKNALEQLQLGITNGTENAQHVCRVLWAAAVKKVLADQGTIESFWDRVKNIVDDARFHASVKIINTTEEDVDEDPIPTLIIAAGDLANVGDRCRMFASSLHRLRIEDLLKPDPLAPSLINDAEADATDRRPVEADLHVLIYLGEDFISEELCNRNPFALASFVVDALREFIPGILLAVGFTTDIRVATMPNTILVGLSCHKELARTGAVILPFEVNNDT